MKRILSLLLALVLLLAGCSRSTPTPSPTDGTDPTDATAFDGSLELGDTMPELTFTTAEGQAVSLTQLLQEKKLVVLNFWFAECGWCLKEFPALEVAYQRSRSDVEILALNPFDSADTVAEFQKNHSLSFPMAVCSRSLALSFGINGYPTSVFIDRNGTVCLIHAGAITDAAVFQTVFDTFTGDDYRQTLYADISELFAAP